MAQFDVYRNHGKGKDFYPYYIDIQNGLFNALTSRVVIPMTDIKNISPIRGLHPVIILQGKQYVIVTDLMTSVIDKDLKQTPVTNVVSIRNEIISALDLLITGI
ncbi:CcdB family protein [Brenneria corticis]|uniref:Toxin CcdB n=1 Tax=Brenneria corticis TaxID=2173106 RepID=A0A2U1U6Y5_9GAMM|nr:CcdB family protein [Brenneria sp. CFCC 11842]PWC17402.1 plasmid maintenance protein CcdB [Brenneria sp. CFCC 11842]